MNEHEARMVLALAESGDEAALRDAGRDIAPAIEWFLEHDRAAAARLAGALADFWMHAGRVTEGRALTERVVAATIAAAAADHDIAAAVPRALLAASELAFRQGDDKAAAKRARDAVRAAMLIEDRATAARAYTHLAQLAHWRGDGPALEENARKALDLADDDPLATDRDDLRGERD